jgi:transposase-like protein
MSMPAYFAVSPLFVDEDACIQFLVDEGVFYTAFDCPSCGQPMTRYSQFRKFRCRRRACNTNVSFRVHSFFFGHTSKCSKILFLGYLWLTKVSVTSAITMSGQSPNTVCAFWKYFRQLVASSLDEESVVIGGPGIVVEIDEAKFGKRKYHRGHRVEGVWIFGGIERTPERKVFAVRVENRSAETLVPIIQRYIRPGSIIHSDMWRSYAGLRDLGYEHYTVNHSEHFVDPDSYACTNTIEGTWNGMKANIRPRSRTREDVEGHLYEFIWRRQNADDLWRGFISALRTVYYE